jgi:uncharacterized protein YjiS (DUF1127 family)
MRRIFEYFRNALALRETQRQLYSLSDHMLRDIGLNRDGIPSALLERVVLPEPRLPQVGPGGLVAEPDRRREVPAA